MINYFGMESSMNYVSTELSKKKQKENRIMLEKFFKLQENHTTVKTEIIAGFTTFMTMAYILAVNPNILSAAGMNPQAVLIATALASFAGTLLMAFLANYPFALAPGHW